jgi:Uma2 family endonuclease
MNMSTLHKSVLISPEEYLEDERRSAIKCEYVAGHIYAMVGTSVAHNLIAGNLYTALRSHLRGGPCRVFMADLKVYVEKAQAFYYPDVAVSCHAADTQPSTYCIENPTLIIEVLSPSTERIDREEKLHNYQMLERLQEYVLVTQERREVQIYRRSASSWGLEVYATGDQVRLSSVGLELPIQSIYAEV